MNAYVTKVHQCSTDVWLTFKVGGRLYKKTSLQNKLLNLYNKRSTIRFITYNSRNCVINDVFHPVLNIITNLFFANIFLYIQTYTFSKIRVLTSAFFLLLTLNYLFLPLFQKNRSSLNLLRLPLFSTFGSRYCFIFLT